MGLQDTVSAERLHIGFFGMRNAGKSSLVNAVTGQDLAVVSPVKGTTTDPVKKAMELLPLGPVVIIDTPGLDDEGSLGALRIKKAKQTLDKTDIAVLVVDAQKGPGREERELIALFEEWKLPYVAAYNKADLLQERKPLPENGIYVSAVSGENIRELKEKLGAISKADAETGSGGREKRIVTDLLSPGELVVLVVPVDESAPKGRLILPQQQVMRELLDAHCLFAVCQHTELRETLTALAVPPRLVVTDSQVIEEVAAALPADIALTSFSILFARYRGDLNRLVQGAARLSTLRDGDRVLISEGCTHHRQCGDIGTVKLPGWIEAYSGAKPDYAFTSGGEFPEQLEDFALIIHCGGCMLNEKEMKSRLERAARAGVPVVNYGVAIAQMNGILARSIAPLREFIQSGLLEK